MEKATDGQISLILDLNLIGPKKVFSLSASEAAKLFNILATKLYATKLVKWGVLTTQEAAAMSPRVLRVLYNLRSRQPDHYIQGLQKIINKFLIGDTVRDLTNNKIGRIIEIKTLNFGKTSNHFSIKYLDGSVKNVHCRLVAKINAKKIT